MKILALDAATEACSVALQIDDQVISRFEICPQQHSQKLLPMVDEVLVEAGLSLTQLDGLAFGQGPGSFTGVRIGVAISQGLAFGADLPLVGISNLAIMAQEAISIHQADKVLSAIDARMNEVYWGLYQNQQGLAVLIDNEHVCSPENITIEVYSELDTADKLYNVGTGWQTYESELQAKFPSQKTKVQLPNAKYMLPLAYQKFTNQQQVSAEQAQPNYVRNEVTWKKLPGR